MELTLKQIAEVIDGTLTGDGQVVIRGINSLSSAGKGEISFLADYRLKEQIRTTKRKSIESFLQTSWRNI